MDEGMSKDMFDASEESSHEIDTSVIDVLLKEHKFRFNANSELYITFEFLSGNRQENDNRIVKLRDRLQSYGYICGLIDFKQYTFTIGTKVSR